ncbi:hypothetical protein N9D88_03255 [Alphaproteobacteria bacterium]|nr:hypothetical protein [Alphaproteobacteria bacterium]
MDQALIHLVHSSAECLPVGPWSTDLQTGSRSAFSLFHPVLND